MSNIVPPSISLPAGATRAAPSGVAGTITNPPPAIAQLAGGTILRGEVLRQDGRGHTLIATDLGTLTVLSNARLARGTQVILQLRAAGAELHVTIMQVDPQAAQGPREGAQALPYPAQAKAPGPPPVAGAAVDTLALGQSLNAVLESPAPGTADPATQDTVSLRLGAGSRMRLRVLQVQAPGAPPTNPTPAAGPARDGTDRGARFAGVVTGSTTSGQPLVRTAHGLLSLNLQTSLARGTELLFQLETVAAAPRGAGREPMPAGPATLSRGWPRLDVALDALQHIEAGAGQSLLADSGVPRPGPRLTSTILFFLQALGRGDLTGWLGQPATEALGRAGRGDLLGQLGRDLIQLGKLADGAGAEWRFLPIPLFDGGPVQPIRLFVRPKQGRGGGDSDADEATRFVVEVELSRFGDMQLDGLVREQRFDLILRTRQPLAETMRRDIVEIFETANELSGSKGQIVFRASRDWHFMPLRRAGPAGPELLV